MQISAWGPDAPTNPACPSGPVTFTDGYHNIADSMAVSILDVVYAEFDHDGA